MWCNQLLLCGDDFTYACILKMEPREWLKFLKLNNNQYREWLLLKMGWRTEIQL
jgi:hypothetical protein